MYNVKNKDRTATVWTHLHHLFSVSRATTLRGLCVVLPSSLPALVASLHGREMSWAGRTAGTRLQTKPSRIGQQGCTDRQKGEFTWFFTWFYHHSLMILFLQCCKHICLTLGILKKQSLSSFWTF